MRSSTSRPIPLAQDVTFTENDMLVRLKDGRSVSVPLSWFPRLLQASEEIRQNWQLLGNGEGIHWPGADEDLSVEGLLLGSRSAGLEASAI